jgi:CheY-like chemotaxis protein
LTTDVAPLVVTLLGGLQLRLTTGAVLTVSSKKARAVAAYLSMPPGTAYSPATLIRLLWGEPDDPHARRAFADDLAALRGALVSASLSDVLIEGDQIWLNRAAVEVDVGGLERLIAEGTPASIERAAALYGGHFLDRFAVDAPRFMEWVFAQRDRLKKLAIAAMEDLLKHQLRINLVDPAIRTALRALEVDPFREPVHRALMRLYAGQGRAGAALRQYQTVQSVVQGQANPETRKLYEEILGQIFRAKPASAPGPKSILIVEDDAASRSLVEQALRTAGYKVIAAEDGADALLKLGGQNVDLVVSDINMPNLTGVQLLDIMHKHAIETPVLFVTGYSADEVESQGLALGPDDYIQKPFRQAALLELVRKAIERGASR